jgi:hypothetical protein
MPDYKFSGHFPVPQITTLHRFPAPTGALPMLNPGSRSLIS